MINFLRLLTEAESQKRVIRHQHNRRRTSRGEQKLDDPNVPPSQPTEFDNSRFKIQVLMSRLQKVATPTLIVSIVTSWTDNNDYSDLNLEGESHTEVSGP